jgi:hypothetical protein
LASSTAFHHSSLPTLLPSTWRTASRIGVAAARAEPDELGVEVPLLGFGVHLEEDGQPPPHGAETGMVIARPLLEHAEHPPLLAVLVKDHFGDVHVVEYGPVEPASRIW